MFVCAHRKKMNFTTDLPKRNPLVSYIVASAVRCVRALCALARRCPPAGGGQQPEEAVCDECRGLELCTARTQDAG